MQKSKLFIIFIISFLGGILLCEFFLEEEFIKMGACGLFGFLFLNEVREFSWKVFVIVVLGVALGFLRFFFSFEVGEEYLSNYVGNVSVRGCITTEVDVRDDKVKYTLDAYFIEVEDERRPVRGKVLVNALRYPVYEFGDCLLVSGELQRPEKIEDFDYDKYLARYGIYSVMYQAEIEKLDENRKGNFIRVVRNMLYGWIFELKGDFGMRLQRILAEPHASFMAGLILGSRKGIPEHLMTDFNTTGLTHIIAISGYNITLVIVIVSAMFGFLSRRKKVIASIIFIIVFVILVGMSAAVVRAAIMGCIGLIAIWFGRQYFVVISLFVAAFFMNLWNPKILVYDVGFQLSFLATCGLVFISPYFEKYFKWLPGFFGIREAVMMTLSAQVLALPIIILNFGRLSLISPFANVFVLPFIPLAMIFGFFAVSVSYLWGFLGQIFGFIGYLILELMILFVKFFAAFKFASLEVSGFSWWMLWIYFYLVLKWVIGKNKF